MDKKNYIESIELSTGTTVYVQTVNGRWCLSFDNRKARYSIWLEPSELEQLADKINQLVHKTKAVWHT